MSAFWSKPFAALCYGLWVLVRPSFLADICSITPSEEGSPPSLLPGRGGNIKSPIHSVDPQEWWSSSLLLGESKRLVHHEVFIPPLPARAEIPCHWSCIASMVGGSVASFTLGGGESPDSMPGVFWTPAWCLVTAGRFLTWCCYIAAFPHGLHNMGVRDHITAYYMPATAGNCTACHTPYSAFSAITLVEEFRDLLTDQWRWSVSSPPLLAWVGWATVLSVMFSWRWALWSKSYLSC